MRIRFPSPWDCLKDIWSKIPAYSRIVDCCYFVVYTAFMVSFVYLLKQQIQKRYKQWYRSQLPSIFLLSAYWCWWCWRYWLGPGAQWWGAPCAQEPHQGGSGNLSRRPSLSCRRGDTRWWCSVTPCALKSFQIQSQSSFLECRITFKTLLAYAS